MVAMAEVFTRSLPLQEFTHLWLLPELSTCRRRPQREDHEEVVWLQGERRMPAINVVKLVICRISARTVRLESREKKFCCKFNVCLVCLFVLAPSKRGNSNNCL